MRSPDYHTHLRHLARVAANEEEDTLLWALGEIARLRDALATCRELRGHDAKEIERLKVLIRYHG